MAEVKKWYFTAILKQEKQIKDEFTKNEFKSCTSFDHGTLTLFSVDCTEEKMNIIKERYIITPFDGGMFASTTPI